VHQKACDARVSSPSRRVHSGFFHGRSQFLKELSDAPEADGDYVLYWDAAAAARIV
jgi:hypothetical protein